MAKQPTVKSVSLFYRDGSSDKEYNVFLDGSNGMYIVNFTYGRRGNATASGTKTSSAVPLAQAEKIYDKLVSEKMAKGYVPNGEAKPFTSVDTADRVSGLIPMLLNPIEESEMDNYINNDYWLAQEKLDGKRIMIRVTNGEVVGSNRKGLTVGIPREVEQDLSVLSDVVLDGELIGDRYYAFDILEYKGNVLRDEHCINRFDNLRRVLLELKDTNVVLIVSNACTTEQKQELVKSLRHKEGVVFKHKKSAYVSGRPNSGGYQLKCKFWSDVSVQVLKVNDKASIQVGIFDGTQLVPIGNVTINGHATPKVGDIVDVTYLYAYKGGSLYQPKYKGVRDDVDVDHISKLKYKSENED